MPWLKKMKLPLQHSPALARRSQGVRQGASYCCSVTMHCERACRRPLLRTSSYGSHNLNPSLHVAASSGYGLSVSCHKVTLLCTALHMCLLGTPVTSRCSSCSWYQT